MWGCFLVAQSRHDVVSAMDRRSRAQQKASEVSIYLVSETRAKLYGQLSEMNAAHLKHNLRGAVSLYANLGD